LVYEGINQDLFREKQALPISSRGARILNGQIRHYGPH